MTERATRLIKKLSVRFADYIPVFAVSSVFPERLFRPLREALKGVGRAQ
jgi:hypothetical protein